MGFSRASDSRDGVSRVSGFPFEASGVWALITKENETGVLSEEKRELDDALKPEHRLKLAKTKAWWAAGYAWGCRSAPAPGVDPSVVNRRISLARIKHTFLKKFLFHRAHRGPNRGHGVKHLVRFVASVGGLRALWAKNLVNVRVKYPG
jgi:hypothetical protein